MNYVTLKDLATQLGIDRSNLRKYALKHGFNLASIRTPESRAQRTLALTPDDAEQIKALRQAQGYDLQSIPDGNGHGYFYAIQLIPELDPKRIKFGFATDIEARLSAHRTAAPTACLLRHWPCRKHWEYTAIDAITHEDSRCISNEVYDVEDVVVTMDRADAFFSLLPIP